MTHIHYAAVLPSGDILQTGIVDSEETLKNMVFESAVAIKCPEWVNDVDHYYKSGAYHKYPPKPSEYHVWDGYDWVDFRTEDQEREQYRAEITSIRDGLLAASDWTQVLDSPLSPEKRADWAKYRQELRDITLQPDYSNIIWPKKPE